MTIYFRSRVICVRNVPQKVENKKTTNAGISLVAYTNTLPVGLYDVICSYYMNNIIVVSQKGLMNNYFRSRGIWVHHVTQKLENKKTPSSGFFL